MARVCPKCGAKFDDRVGQCPNDGSQTLVVGDEQGLVGKTIDGRFTVRSLIGVGGMGTVFRAHQHSMDRDVALKVLHKDLASNEQEVMRFFREAKAASSLSGAHTITVFDFGQTDDGLLYLVMELLKGMSLADQLERSPGPMEPRRAAGIAGQVLDALVQAHAGGVLHRDLKPDNIFLVDEGDGRDFVKVLDFGIAKVMGRESTNLTATGMVVGTPTYMSPEQGLGEDLDQRSDLYSVGTILFELLAGRPPFEAETPVAIVVKKVHEPAPGIRQVNPSAGVSSALEDFVARLLSTDPANRPGDARETRSLLKQVMGSGFEPRQPGAEETPESGKTEIGKPVAPAAPTAVAEQAPRPPAKTPPPAMMPKSPRPIAVRDAIKKGTARRPKARRVRNEKSRAGFTAAAVLAFALTAILLIWAAFGWESAPEGTTEPEPPVVSDTAPVRLADLPLTVKPALPEEVENEARGLLSSMEGGNAVDAIMHIERIAQMRKSRQIGNLTSLAAVFLTRFDESTSEVSPARAARLASTAIDLAPDYPDLYFNLSSAHLRSGVTGFGPAVSAAVRGLSTYARYPRGLLVTAANASFYLLMALLAIALTVPLLLLAKHGSKLTHDVGDVYYAAPSRDIGLTDKGGAPRASSGLRRIVSRAPVAAVVIMALLFPYMAGMGVLSSLVLVLLAAALYAERSEIAAILVSLVSILLLVPIGIAVHLPLDAEASTSSTTWSCTQEYCSDDQSERLEKAVLDKPDGTWTYMGLAYSRLHEAPDSPSVLSSAIQYLEAATPDRLGAVLTLLGNVRVLHALASCPDGVPHTGSLAAAVESFEKAAHGVREPAEALRGLAVAQGLLGKRKAMKETIDRLVGLTRESDLTFQEKIPSVTGGKDTCGALASLASELRTPRPRDLEVYLGGLDVTRIEPALPMRGLLMGSLTPRLVILFALIGIVFLPVSVMFGGRYRLAVRCPKCGNISCGKCDVRASGFDYCPNCLKEQVRPAFIDPLDQVAMERRQDDQKRWKSVLLSLFALVAPGSVQVASGRPLRGVLMVFLLALSMAWILMPVPPLQDGGAYQGLARVHLSMAPPLVLVTVFLWSALDVWLRRD